MICSVAFFSAGSAGSAGSAEGRGVQDAATAPPMPPAITDGATAFKTRGCAQCHEIGNAGGHKGPNLSGVGRRLKKDAIENQIVKGGDAMPAFGDALQHDEIAGLVDYLHRQKAKTPAYIKPSTPAPAPTAPAPE